MAAPRMHIETDTTPSNEPAGKPENVSAPMPEVTPEEVEAPAAEAEKPVEQQKKVVATVVRESEPEPEPEAPQPKAEVAPSGSETAKDASEEEKGKKGSGLNMRDWVHKTFPGHEGAFWGAVIALIIALLIFMIGFFRVLLIVLLVVIGIALGQIIDGDPKIIRAITRLFGGDREDR